MRNYATVPGSAVLIVDRRLQPATYNQTSCFVSSNSDPVSHNMGSVSDPVKKVCAINPVSHEAQKSKFAQCAVDLLGN